VKIENEMEIAALQTNQFREQVATAGLSKTWQARPPKRQPHQCTMPSFRAYPSQPNLRLTSARTYRKSSGQMFYSIMIVSMVNSEKVSWYSR
jgi:hypothetical protein